MSQVTLENVRDGLLAEDLLSTDDQQRADELIEQLREIQPWYVRTMVGFGAWLASLLLIGFVAGIGFAADGGYIFFGLGMIVAAIAVRRNNQADFMVQSALAVSLAGQGLFAFGIAELSNLNEFEMVMVVVIVMSAILFVLFPDRIHRVLSVLFASSSLAMLFYAWEWADGIPLLGPAFAAALVYLHHRQASFAGSGRGALIRPLMNGLMLSAFGCLMLSTIYVLPEMVDDFRFYPRPWISTLLLGGLFLYLGSQTWPRLLGENSSAAGVVYGLMVMLVAAAWAAPGLLLALLVVLMGAASGSRLFIGTGIGFLVVFVGAYFYGIDISMMEKSATLVASGVTILMARWLLFKVLGPAAAGGADHE